MSSPKPKHKKKRILLFLLFSIFAPLCCIALDRLANEDRDYALNAQMIMLTRQLDKYKIQHGKYPKTILDIRTTDQLCVTDIYIKCQKVYYQPIHNYQDFHLAMHSFTWVILWYKKNACIDPKQSLLNHTDPEYFFCAATPEHNSPIKNSPFPIYREDKRVFDHPNEWPTL